MTLKTFLSGIAVGCGLAVLLTFFIVLSIVSTTAPIPEHVVNMVMTIWIVEMIATSIFLIPSFFMKD